MKRLQPVLFLCAALSTFGRNVAKHRPGNCVAACTGTNYLNYQKGSRYIYEYTTVASTFLQGNSHENSGLTVQCLVNIEVLDKCHQILTASAV